MAGNLLKQRGSNDGSIQFFTGELLAAGGGVRATAEKLSLLDIGVGKSMLARYADTHTPTPPGSRKPSMPADLVLAIEQMTGNPVVTEFLAAEQGYTLSRPHWPKAEVVNFFNLNYRLTEHAMKIIVTGAEQNNGKPLSRADAIAWRADIRRLMNVCAQVDCALTSEIGGNPADTRNRKCWRLPTHVPSAAIEG